MTKCNMSTMILNNQSLNLSTNRLIIPTKCFAFTNIWFIFAEYSYKSQNHLLCYSDFSSSF